MAQISRKPIILLILSIITQGLWASTPITSKALTAPQSSAIKSLSSQAETVAAGALLINAVRRFTQIGNTRSNLDAFNKAVRGATGLAGAALTYYPWLSPHPVASAAICAAAGLDLALSALDISTEYSRNDAEAIETKATINCKCCGLPAININGRNATNQDATAIAFCNRCESSVIGKVFYNFKQNYLKRTCALVVGGIAFAVMRKHLPSVIDAAAHAAGGVDWSTLIFGPKNCPNPKCNFPLR